MRRTDGREGKFPRKNLRKTRRTPAPEGRGFDSVFFQLLAKTRRKKVYNIMMFTL